MELKLIRSQLKRAKTESGKRLPAADGTLRTCGTSSTCLHALVDGRLDGTCYFQIVSWPSIVMKFRTEKKLLP